MNLIEGTAAYINYNGTERTVIPLETPSDSVLCVDVTGMPTLKKTALVELAQEYAQYRQRHISMLYSFDDFVEQQYEEKLEIKWRNFKLDKIS